MTTQAKTVSVIIPCYNAEQWICEAVDSCLNQTYNPIEVIVIDDGSTDKSLSRLRSYENKIQVEVGPNRGGNYARNRGFALSKGEYIQFLDADDYILPKKIVHQVSFLEETKADVVYGDWRHQFHESNDQVCLGDVIVSNKQEDILESLLAGWWVAPVALLFRRQAVINSGGWDESLTAAQDKDFFISVAMNGLDIRYQPGCYSIYRPYGNVTVSTSNRLRWLDNHRRVLEKAESRLLSINSLTSNYKNALADSYFHLARNYYDIDKAMYKKLFAKTLSLNKTFIPRESGLYNTVSQLIGYASAEWLASIKRCMPNHKFIF